MISDLTNFVLASRRLVCSNCVCFWCPHWQGKLPCCGDRNSARIRRRLGTRTLAHRSRVPSKPLGCRVRDKGLSSLKIYTRSSVECENGRSKTERVRGVSSSLNSGDTAPDSIKSLFGVQVCRVRPLCHVEPMYPGIYTDNGDQPTQEKKRKQRSRGKIFRDGGGSVDRVSYRVRIRIVTVGPETCTA